MSKPCADKNFVVYGYYRENWTPYYIGKGRPNRPYKKGGRPCPMPPCERILILYKNLDEDSAYELEKKLIKRYGRKGIDGGGILLNKSSGGRGSHDIIFSSKTRKKMSESAKSKGVSGRNHQGTKLHDWTHTDYGDQLSLSIKELIEKYPDQKLKYFSLSNVVSELQISSKGWKLLKNKHIPVRPVPESNKRLCTWEHPDHGIYENTSVPDLIKIFPELNRGNLQMVMNGKRSHHKKWKVLNNNCNDFIYGPKKLNWVHDAHGVVLNATVPELIEMFPDQKLASSALSLLKNGKISQHKGWRIK